jgi:hypothetical protein
MATQQLSRPAVVSGVECGGHRALARPRPLAALAIDSFEPQARIYFEPFKFTELRGLHPLSMQP